MPAKQSRGQAKAKERKKTAGPKAAAKLCFVLMPFREPFGTYYERIYVPAIRGADLEPRRIDEVFRAGTIIKDIWDYTVGAQVLVAELTGRNPNVFYELGLAHAIAKPVVLVTQTIDDVPFDLKHLRHILYNTIDPDWATKLQEDLTRAIVETLEDPAASLALPSVASVPSAGAGEAAGESDVMRLLKAVDSKIDYMRREGVIGQTWMPRQIPFFEEDISRLREPEVRELVELLEAGVPGSRALQLARLRAARRRRQRPKPLGGESEEADR